MIIYLFWLGLGFIFDKISMKLINLLFLNTSKQLLLCYTSEWHASQRQTLLDMIEWVIL